MDEIAQSFFYQKLIIAVAMFVHAFMMQEHVHICLSHPQEA